MNTAGYYTMTPPKTKAKSPKHIDWDAFVIGVAIGIVTTMIIYHILFF